MNQEPNSSKLFETVFVTVGNGQFDPLIKEIDRLKGEGKISGKVIIQIGYGSYEPKHCEFFKFAPKLHEYYDKASFVVCHGGPGTVFEILRRELPMIALANKDRTDPRHQVEYLEGISEETDALLYCPDVKRLEEFLEMAKGHDFIPYQRPECKIHELVNEFLDEIDESK
jgi:UDP-N-acetylglucosamine transferase subunit ALG13